MPVYIENKIMVTSTDRPTNRANIEQSAFSNFRKQKKGRDFQKLKSDIGLIERSKGENIVLCASILTLRDFKKETIVRGRTSITNTDRTSPIPTLVLARAASYKNSQYWPKEAKILDGWMDWTGWSGCP